MYKNLKIRKKIFKKVSAICLCLLILIIANKKVNAFEEYLANDYDVYVNEIQQNQNEDISLKPIINEAKIKIETKAKFSNVMLMWFKFKINGNISGNVNFQVTINIYAKESKQYWLLEPKIDRYFVSDNEAKEYFLRGNSLFGVVNENIVFDISVINYFSNVDNFYFVLEKITIFAEEMIMPPPPPKPPLENKIIDFINILNKDFEQIFFVLKSGFADIMFYKGDISETVILLMSLVGFFLLMSLINYIVKKIKERKKF